jgi:hypothetical protein
MFLENTSCIDSMQQVHASSPRQIDRFVISPIAKKRNHSFTNEPVPHVKNMMEEKKNIVMSSLI